MKQTAQIFQKAYALVKDPASFTRGALARNADDLPCAVDDPKAARFCSMGALAHVYDSYPGEIFDALQQAMHFDIVQFNNTRPHEEVVAAWQLAGLTRGWLETPIKEETPA